LCLIIPERHVKTYYKGAMLGTQFVSQHETYLPLYITIPETHFEAYQIYVQNGFGYAMHLSFVYI